MYTTFIPATSEEEFKNTLGLYLSTLFYEKIGYSDTMISIYYKTIDRSDLNSTNIPYFNEHRVADGEYLVRGKHYLVNEG